MQKIYLFILFLIHIAKTLLFYLNVVKYILGGIIMIERENYLEKLKLFKDKQIIKVITGIRRCGKSTLLELFKEYLKKDNVANDQIISINFEDINYENLTNYKDLYNYIEKKLCKNRMNYIFLDEIQNVIHFEKTIDSLFIKKNVDLYITGSNAYLLSGELATLLSGRYIKIEMLPLSFKEFMQISNSTNPYDAFNQYLKFGSFPFIHELNNNQIAINDYLNGIYSTILLKDIASRKKIQNITILESIIKFLMDNIGNITSTNKICNTLNSNGKNISIHTVDEYIEALKESYIIYKVNRFDIKGKEHLKSLEKYYIIDIGLRNMLLNSKESNIGHLLENIVYLELLRRGYNVSIGKIGNEEVDFIASNSEDIIYFQVSASVLDEETLKRELRPLDKITDHYQKYLLTLDNLPTASYNGIKRINVIDWLLDTKKFI